MKTIILLAGVLCSFYLFTIVACNKPIICMHGRDGSYRDFHNFSTWVKSTRQHDKYHVLAMDINNDIDTNKQLDKQVDEVVEFFKKIHQDPLFANGYHILAHGQGAAIMRCAIERMDDHKVDSFVTVAGVNAGYYGVQNLPKYLFENLNDEATNKAASYESLQNISGPINLWRDMNYVNYLKTNKFLPYCNNERGYEFNPKYAANFHKVKNFVMFGSPQDGQLIPWYTSIFDTMSEGGIRMPLETSPHYVPSLTATIAAATLPIDPALRAEKLTLLAAEMEAKKVLIQRTSFNVNGFGTLTGGHRVNFFLLPPTPSRDTIVYPERSPFDRRPAPKTKPADPPANRGFGIYEMSQEFRVFSYEIPNVKHYDWLNQPVLFPVIINFGLLN